ncbi:hypothetical protein HHI36_009207, partial [Cryptolaemus montrouzieri]
VISNSLSLNSNLAGKDRMQFLANYVTFQRNMRKFFLARFVFSYMLSQANRVSMKKEKAKVASKFGYMGGFSYFLGKASAQIVTRM